MPGVTKHIFESEIRDILSMWGKQIESIKNVLPQYYKGDDILNTVKLFYPHEWNSVEYKYIYYHKKDKHLKSFKGKVRYNMQKPEELFKNVAQYKKILSSGHITKYADEFKDDIYNENLIKLQSLRIVKIEKVNKKIESAKLKTQQVTPTFLDQLIGLYERKNTTQKDKVYILKELKKYYCVDVIQFFYKLNDTELNKQLRWEAFYHLQSFNYQPRARKQKYMHIHSKNKKRKEFLKKIYPDEKFIIPENPNELEYRIENSKEQKIKVYDFFICHSSLDSKDVQTLIRYQNEKGKNIFCDWINDVDYLKRYLVCDATLKVIEKRLEQSNSLLFVSSDNSKESIWCKYELNYFNELKKPIFVIDRENIERNEFEINELTEQWFIDSNYKKLKVVNSSQKSNIDEEVD